MNVTKHFGSDVFVGYTARYTWNSNQMAHAMMGFAGVSLLAYALTIFGCDPAWAIAFLAIPFLKDVADFAVDSSKGENVFHIDCRHLKEMLMDAFTDFSFWATGAFLAASVVTSPGGAERQTDEQTCLFVAYVALFLLFFAILLVRLRPHYNERKRFFDESRLPFARLPMFKGNFEGKDEGKDAVKVVKEFAGGEKGPEHLIITGPRCSGKTVLAAGIGVEITNRKKAVRYLSLWTLEDELNGIVKQCSERKACSPSVAEVLIVDDVDIGKVQEIIDKLNFLKCKRTVWVMRGDDQNALKKLLNDNYTEVRLAKLSAEAQKRNPAGCLARTMSILACVGSYIVSPAVLLLASIFLLGVALLLLCPWVGALLGCVPVICPWLTPDSFY